MRTKRISAIASLALMLALSSSAQHAGESRKYTNEHPLIYEDVRDLWPYSFLNDKGEPDGFNVELVRLIMGDLGIPYTIRMTSSQEVFDDLKAGRADLTMALSAGFHDEYGHYSENSVTLFTQSIVSPKSKPSTVHNLHDLASHKVYVKDNSFTHHLMIDYGWGENAVPTKAVGSTLQQMSTEEEGELVWNTISLKWLLSKFHLDNLQIQPVNMPHGEYKFMSNDDRLLGQLDSMLVELSSTDKLTPLNNKWFYPDRQEQELPAWTWYAVGGVALAILILLTYILSYRIQASRIKRENSLRNRRLALVLETSEVRVWTYDLGTKQFTWRNEYGQPAYVYEREEFAQRYSADDFAKIENAMKLLASHTVTPDGEAKDITLHIKAQDAREDGDTEMHDFIMTLSVLSHDKKGRPTVLIGTKKDVTKLMEAERKDNERNLRYQALINTPIVGIMFFGNDGRLENINQKACKMFGCEHDEIVAEQPSFNHVFCIDIPLAEADDFHATQMACFDRVPIAERKVKAMKRTTRMYNEYKLVAVDDDEGKPLGLFAFCKDVTFEVNSQEEQARHEVQLAEAKCTEQEYIATINDFILTGKTRIASYSPASHVFTVLRDSKEVQHALTPTRLMTLVDNRMRIRAMHIIGKMDAKEPTNVDVDIRTTLRARQGVTLWLHIHLRPQTDEDGNVTEYLGILNDISELKNIESQLAQVEAKTQEVEDTKNAFIRNMMLEIRNPMGNVINKAGKLTTNDTEQQLALRHDILSNAEHLTHIIDNILYLSRLEAHMMEIVNSPVDFASLFQQHCNEGLEKDLKPDVRCIIENPYDQLVVDIDAVHLGNIISQLTRNAAQHTHSGVIHTRYDYIGRRLMITIDDTGEGIAPDVLQTLNSEYVSGIHTSIGMGLPICKELLRQMGGHLEISSEKGLGTTAWIILPCQAEVVKRKKNL